MHAGAGWSSEWVAGCLHGQISRALKTTLPSPPHQLLNNICRDLIHQEGWRGTWLAYLLWVSQWCLWVPNKDEETEAWRWGKHYSDDLEMGCARDIACPLEKLLIHSVWSMNPMIHGYTQFHTWKVLCTGARPAAEVGVGAEKILKTVRKEMLW